MTDELRDETHPADAASNMVRNVLLGLAAVYVLGSLFMMFEMSSRIEKLEQRQTAAETAATEMGKTLSSVRSEFKANSQALASKVGMTQKQLASRAEALQREQQDAEQRLSEQQKQQFTAVSGDVAGVKSEVGTVKTDVASTKTELEATKTKLERAIGDLGVQSGLIAKTRDDLDVLKHRGDRNYYEFTLSKSKKSTPVGTISLELKKVDPKRGKYTLNVMADDKTIEKKDKNISEPVQFYSGRDHQLFELVVFTVDKDRVTGYLSTPKNAPVPVETGKAQ
jgi:hypothetical protein